MSTDSNNKHLTDERIMQYLDELLNVSDERAVEEHFADCDTCADRARHLQVLNNAWNAWTAKSHGSVNVQVAMNIALENAAAKTDDESLKSRLEKWRESWAGKAEAAAQFVKGEISDIISEGMETLIDIRDEWLFAIGPELSTTRGELALGDMDVNLTSETPRVQISVSDETDVLVWGKDLGPEDAPPIALLYLKDSPQYAWSELLAFDPNQEIFIARFENVEAGEYMVVFEPTK